MLDPATITVSTITALAFSEFVKSIAEEAGKTLVSGTGGLVKGLRERIRAQFQGNERAQKVLTEVESGSEAAVAKLEKYLDLEMLEAEDFAAEVRQIAQQIINIQNQSQTTATQENINYGRDQFNFQETEGPINIHTT